jgi:hypothetical protein
MEAWRKGLKLFKLYIRRRSVVNISVWSICHWRRSPSTIVQDAGLVPALVWTRYYEFIKVWNQKNSNEKLEESFEAGKGTLNNPGRQNGK